MSWNWNGPTGAPSAVVPSKRYGMAVVSPAGSLTFVIPTVARAAGAATATTVAATSAGATMPFRRARCPFENDLLSRIGSLLLSRIRARRR
jgi:hypothetical protein